MNIITETKFNEKDIVKHPKFGACTIRGVLISVGKIDGKFYKVIEYLILPNKQASIRNMGNGQMLPVAEKVDESVLELIKRADFKSGSGAN